MSRVPLDAYSKVLTKRALLWRSTHGVANGARSRRPAVPGSGFLSHMNASPPLQNIDEEYPYARWSSHSLEMSWLKAVFLSNIL